MTNGDHPDRRIELGLFAASALLVLVATVAAPATAASTTTTVNASEKAPYYNGSQRNVSAVGWIPSENATLDNLVTLAVRVSPSLIGTGTRDPSGTGLAGVLLMALVFGGVTLGAVAGTGIGPVGGTILGMAVSYGVVDVGLAPAWLKPVLLFGIAVIAAVVVKRSLE